MRNCKVPLAMSGGIEADDIERTLDMAFRAVGDLAVEVLRNARIAAGQPREDEASPPIASTSGGPLGGKLNEGAGKDGDPTQPIARDVRQTTKPFGAASIASLPVGRSIVMASPAVRPRKRQAPKVSAMIIDLSIHRARRHELTNPW